MEGHTEYNKIYTHKCVYFIVFIRCLEPKVSFTWYAVQYHKTTSPSLSILIHYVNTISRIYKRCWNSGQTPLVWHESIYSLFQRFPLSQCMNIWSVYLYGDNEYAAGGESTYQLPRLRIFKATGLHEWCSGISGHLTLSVVGLNLTWNNSLCNQNIVALSLNTNNGWILIFVFYNHWRLYSLVLFCLYFVLKTSLSIDMVC